MKKTYSYVRANRMAIAVYPQCRKGWNWPQQTAALRLGTRNPTAGRVEAIPYRESFYTPKPMRWAVPRIMTHIYGRRVPLAVWTRFSRGKQQRVTS